MKKYLLAVASLLALTVAAQAADVSRPGQAKVAPAYSSSAVGCANSGFISLAGGTGSTTGYYDYTAAGLAVSASQNICGFVPGYNLQLDVAGDVYDSSTDYATGFLGGSAHVYTRNSAYALGVVVGASKLFEGYEDYASGVLGHFGVEGQMYNGNMTFAGQAVMHRQIGGQSEYSYNPDYATDISAELRYFLNPNLKLSARVGYYADHDPYSEYDHTATYFKLAGEMLLDRTGVSIFADYSARNGEIEGDALSSSTMRVGIKSQWGQGSLLSQDRTGSSFYMPTIDSVQNGINAFYR